MAELQRPNVRFTPLRCTNQTFDKLFLFENQTLLVHYRRQSTSQHSHSRCQSIDLTRLSRRLVRFITVTLEVAMPILNLHECQRDPNSSQCLAAREELRRFLREIYILRWIRPLIPPLPSPFGGGPQPEPPTISATLANQNFLIGELLAHALGDPNPQPNTPSLINEIKKSGVHLEVVNELIDRFEIATTALRAEAKALASHK